MHAYEERVPNNPEFERTSGRTWPKSSGTFGTVQSVPWDEKHKSPRFRRQESFSKSLLRYPLTHVSRCLFHRICWKTRVAHLTDSLVDGAGTKKRVFRLHFPTKGIVLYRPSSFSLLRLFFLHRFSLKGVHQRIKIDAFLLHPLRLIS